MFHSTPEKLSIKIGGQEEGTRARDFKNMIHKFGRVQQIIFADLLNKWSFHLILSFGHGSPITTTR